MGQIN